MALKTRRREFITFAAVTLFVGARPLRADQQTKKGFMSAAITEINNRLERIASEEERLRKEGKASALFVKIPRIIPFVDWDYYYLESELKWVSNPGSRDFSVTIPKGFVTDLASTPAIIWAKYPPMGRYAYAAVVHDYLYWTQKTTRKEADEILVEGMKDARVDKSTVEDFYVALRVAGGRAWDNNAAAKAAGEKRVLSRFPSDPLMSWETWKKTKDVFAPD